MIQFVQYVVADCRPLQFPHCIERVQRYTREKVKPRSLRALCVWLGSVWEMTTQITVAKDLELRVYDLLDNRIHEPDYPSSEYMTSMSLMQHPRDTGDVKNDLLSNWYNWEEVKCFSSISYPKMKGKKLVNESPRPSTHMSTCQSRQVHLLLLARDTN